MNVEEISKLNEANFVLRHFINLSARLLPFLEELQKKEHPTRQEILNREKIIDVFENYSFDTHTSELLIDSNILELIKKSYEHISRRNYNLKPGQKCGPLNRFLKEYHRLSISWDLASTN